MIDTAWHSRTNIVKFEMVLVEVSTVDVFFVVFSDIFLALGCEASCVILEMVHFARNGLSCSCSLLLSFFVAQCFVDIHDSPTLEKKKKPSTNQF